jgi:hypothetical protein
MAGETSAAGVMVSKAVLQRKRIILVSGIPASGKSTYARWLALRVNVLVIGTNVQSNAARRDDLGEQTSGGRRESGNPSAGGISNLARYVWYFSQAENPDSIAHIDPFGGIDYSEWGILPEELASEEL